MSEKKTMLNVAEALDLLLGTVRPLTEVDRLPTQSANGRVLATTQSSSICVPPMDNAQMDGYAVRVAECASGAAAFAVSQRIAAGQIGYPLMPGTVARIFTGASIPEGADAVVMQEQCDVIDDRVTIRHVPQPGEWIRRAGEDIRAGNAILEAGTRLSPAELGLAASVGIAALPVIRRPHVAVFFTGDELVMPGEELKPGAIYNTNRFTLRGLLENLGCEVTDYGIVPDSLVRTREVLRQAAEGHDLILASGGVSVGEADYIKPAVEAEGTLSLWQIAIKPGKPLAFGEIQDVAGGSPVSFIGLPGNPVSSFVTFLLFVRPFILRLQGVTDIAPRAWSMRADFSWLKADRRNEFLRARVNREGGLDLFPNQGSAVLTSMVWGDGLIDNPPGCCISPGDLVRFIPFNALFH